ncbi:MAG: hypothetical protein LBC61_01610 [Candidatus Peribacteria bacterium]|jgi:hypothetical protein|nr:hypothetical protein [Candidatus Peribacteria bacterium]
MNKSKNISVEIRAIDEEYYSSSEVKNIFISDTTDNIAPTITMINPTDDSIKLYE